jgi:pyruvate kinase
MNPKIIATIGPKSEEYKILKSLAISGMNIARVNFSHATYEQWQKIKSGLTRIEKETGIQVKMMMDLQGPRIRIGRLTKPIELVKGETYAFAYNQENFEQKEIPIDHPNLFKDVKIGEPFYLANGLMELEIVEIKNEKIFGRVLRGGLLISRKGINIPETNLSTDVLTSKDLADAAFGVSNGADYICLSFVQSGDDIKKFREILGNSNTPIIAKIERGTALKDIDSIIKNSNGIMVARGDLGIEVPIEELPILQKELVRQAHWYKKPAIVATEMLISMMDHPHPTRAEVADIANAIFDGADAVMLSDETAAGDYPVESVEVMKKIVQRADEYFNSVNYMEDYHG